MPTWKKLYAPTYPEREARKVIADTSRQACRANAAHYVRSGPLLPILEKVLMGEISVKLVQGYPPTEINPRNIFGMDVRVLPSPSEFDHVLVVDVPAKSESIAGVGVEYYPGVRSGDMRLDLEAHTRAITE
jgi:hypothetical protein